MYRAHYFYSRLRTKLNHLSPKQLGACAESFFFINASILLVNFINNLMVILIISKYWNSKNVATFHLHTFFLIVTMAKSLLHNWYCEMWQFVYNKLDNRIVFDYNVSVLGRLSLVSYYGLLNRWEMRGGGFGICWCSFLIAIHLTITNSQSSVQAEEWHI